MAVAVVEVHPLLRAIAGMEQWLDLMDPAAWTGLDPATAASAAGRLARISARVGAQQVAAARVVDRSGLARLRGATSAAELLGRDLGRDPRAGHQLVRAAQDIRPQSPTEKALASGDVTLLQAGIIAKGLKQLPPTVSDTQREACETQLVLDAQELTPSDLRKRADRITDVFAPLVEVDRIENDLLVEREKSARLKSSLLMSDNGDGTHSGRFTIPDEAAAMLRAALHGLAAPRRSHLIADSSEHFGHRMGLAFTELVSHLSEGHLPDHGGVAATVAVLIDHDVLTGKLVKAGELTDGTRISAQAARRLACQAHLLPAVFGGDSIPLDLGREQRLFTRHQRLVLAKRDGGCSFPNCTRPPGWCEAHHANETWADGGTTNLTDGSLLCGTHHRLVHDDNWHYRLNPHDRVPEYKPAATEAWQRNRRYRP